MGSKVSRLNRRKLVLFAGAVTLFGLFGIRVLYSGLYSIRDFSAFWMSGRALNLGLNPYTQLSTVQAPAVLRGHVMSFLSPIFVAEYMRPFALLPFHVAKSLWLCISLVLALVSLLLLMRLAHIRVSPASVLTGGMVLIAFNPFMFVFDNGQTDVVLLAGLCLSWYLLDRNKLFWSGMALCVGFLNPHLVLGVAVYYAYRIVLRRELRLFWGIALGALILAVVSLPYKAYVIEWFTTILPSAQQWALSASGQLTWVSFFHAVLGSRSEFTWIPTATIDVGTLVLTIAFWRRSQGRHLEFDVAMAIVLGLASTTFAFNQDYLVLILVFPALATIYRSDVAEYKVWCLGLCVSLLFSGMSGFVVPPQHMIVELVAPIILLFTLLAQISGKRVSRSLYSWILVWLGLTVGGYLLSYLFKSTLAQQVLILGGMELFLVGLGRVYWLSRLAVPPLVGVAVKGAYESS